MFRKHYKNAYDKIEPNREIIDKVFAEADEKKKTKVYTFAMRYGVLAAVVALVIVSVKFYPDIVPTPVNEQSFQNVYITEGSEEKQVAEVESTSTSASANEKAKNSALLRDTAEVEFTSAEKKELFMFDEFAEVSEAEKKIVYDFLVDKFGEKDKELGHTFSFGIVGKTQYENNNFYLGRWSWIVNGTHSSLLCEFVLSEDMNQMYEVLYEEDKIVPLYETPLF